MRVSPDRIKLEDEYTLHLDSGIALRVYADNRPTNYEIAGIQKGIVLIDSGRELIEEGAGFGLPVAKYPDKSIFPGTAYTEIVDNPPFVTIEKTYVMNSVSFKELKNYGQISDIIYHPIHQAFTKLYLNFKILRPVFDWVLENRTRAGITTTFKHVEPRGTVKISYTINMKKIDIKVYPDLDPGCTELVLLNEQGASTFRKYSDSRKVLIDRRIGAWQPVKGDYATFSDLHGSLSFSITKPMRSGFYMGREFVKDRFSWSGLALSLNAYNDTEYEILLNENNLKVFHK